MRCGHSAALLLRSFMLESLLIVPVHNPLFESVSTASGSKHCCGCPMPPCMWIVVWDVCWAVLLLPCVAKEALRTGWCVQ